MLLQIANLISPQAYRYNFLDGSKMIECVIWKVEFELKVKHVCGARF